MMWSFAKRSGTLLAFTLRGRQFHRATLFALGLLVAATVIHHMLRNPEPAIDPEFDPFSLHSSFQRTTWDRTEPKPLRQRGQVRRSLPVGSSFDVKISGGFVAQLNDRDYGDDRKAFVAYLFEMPYRSTIEFNNGHRVVEHRHFGKVRMAKIVSPMEGMQIRLGGSDEDILAGLPFRGPSSGIFVTPLEPLARTMLQHGLNDVLCSPASRAYLEEDPLSGNSLRLTSVNGVGVVAIDSIEQPLGELQAGFLFNQCLPSGCHWLPETGKREGFVHVRHLASLLDPTMTACGRYEVRVKPSGRSASGDIRYAIQRPAFAFAGDSSTRRFLPMGSLRYDPSARLVTSATLHWDIADFRPASERLLFERDYQNRPTVKIHYRCKPVK